MHTLEPLCNLDQSELLVGLLFNEPTLYYYSKDKQLCKSNIGFAHFNRKKYPLCACPTISMARNWVFREYGLFMQTMRSSVLSDRYIASYYLQDAPHIHTASLDPHTAESECLTEILKHLKSETCQNK